MLKNTFVWLMMLVVAVTLTFKVVTRPKDLHVIKTPTAIVVTDGKEIRVAPTPPPAPPVAQPEAPRVAVQPTAKPRLKAAFKRPKRVAVKPDNGGNAVSVSCPTLKGYVDKFGRDRVIIGATAYGYTESDARKALSACGL
jgi:hypothetical protein